jgi:hypothetical protein
MMKIYALICTLLLAAALPALAQLAPRDQVTLFGKITAVDARKKEVAVAFSVRVSDVNAPGEMPAEMAQNAATLSDQADRLEKRGKTEEARKLRQQVEEYRHWRVLNVNVAPETPLIGVSRLPLANVAKGAMLRLMVSVEGTAAQLPATVTLTHDAIQLGERTQPLVRPLPRVRGVNKTFFLVVGKVGTASPLTLEVNGQNVRVENPNDFAFIRQERLTLNQLQPGRRVVARARMRTEMEVARLHRLIVLLTNMDTPLAPEDDIELQ